MKNKIYTALLSLALMVGFSACNEKWEPDGIGSSDKGSLSTADLAVDLANAENVIESRASYDLSNFIVSVVDKDGLVVNEWVYSAMPSLPSFTVGTYTLKVESGKPAKAAWDAPYFVGEKQFEIVKDQVTSAGTVTCSLNNLKVTVRFGDDLVAAADGDLECEIRVNEEGVLRFTPTESRSGYFDIEPGNTTMVATFTGTVNGYKEEIIRLYKDLSAGQHRIISFSLKGADIEIPAETGFIDPVGGLNVDFSVVDEDLSANVNTGDEEVIDGERPGGETWPTDPVDPVDPGTDPEQPTPPADDNSIDFTSEYLQLGKGIVNKASEFGDEDGLKPAVVTISAKNGISHLLVTIDSESLDVTDVGLENNFDLAYPGNLAGALGPEGLKFPIADAVINQTSVDFDISQFVPMLALSMFPGQHTFIIKVYDNTDPAKDNVTYDEEPDTASHKTLYLTFVNE
ncbi:MAG: DUF4493 domain-containing protein [Muribaculaceae bacterium]|nr:DUF4493 domain-containing protein [Muribaculaceae bacterium]